MLLPFQGADAAVNLTQGVDFVFLLLARYSWSKLRYTLAPSSVALGYVLVTPSGRALNACAYSLIQLTKREILISNSRNYFAQI